MSAVNRRAALLMVFLVTAPACVLADYHFEANKKDDVSAEERQLAAEITAFLADYAAAYNDQDYRTVKSMWHDDGNPIYMAEEVPFPLYGQERMNNYFNPVPGKRILDGIDNRYSEVRAKFVAPDIAVATYRLDYDIKLAGRPASYGWDRVMAVFVRAADGLEDDGLHRGADGSADDGSQDDEGDAGRDRAGQGGLRDDAQDDQGADRKGGQPGLR